MTQSDTLQIISPDQSAVVDGSVVEFEWLAHNNRPIELQLARSSDFVGAESVRLDHATSMTLYDVLPQDGSTYYWRVRSVNTDGPGSWSEVGSFISGRESQVVAPASGARVQSGTAAVRPQAGSEYRTQTAAGPTFANAMRVDGTTSAAKSWAVIAIMVGSFVLLAMLLRSVVL